MKTNRRQWIRFMGLGAAALSIVPLNVLASPLPSTSPGDEPATGNDTIKLSANENPYGPSPLARAAIAASITRSNRYNWDTITELITAISRKNKVAPENILTGAGSTEILDLVSRLLTASSGSFVVAAPSFTGWTATLENAGCKKISIPLTTDKRLDLKAMLAAIQPDTRFVYVCNPNNPTGTLLEREALVSFLKEASTKTTVMVDEAYIDFTPQPSVSTLCSDNKNLIVVKTFSKIYGLAGLRIGYAIAHEETIEKISRNQSWPNGSVGVVSRAAAIASLKDDGFVRQCYTKNEEAKKYTIEQLTLLGIRCIPSHTNFIYFSLANYKKDFFALLKDRQIQGTRIFEESGQWSRITVGTMAEMQQFIAALK